MIVAIIATGLVAASTVFSVLELVLFRPLPFPEADRLVAIYSVQSSERANPAASGSWNKGMVSTSGWKRLSESASFNLVGAWAPTRAALGYPATDVVELWYVSRSLLGVLGLSPHIGRAFSTEDERSASSESIMLTYESWLHRYGGDAKVLGTTVTYAMAVDEPQVATIVGVLSPGLRLGGTDPEFLLPIGKLPTGEDRPALRLVASLTHGASMKVARDVVEAVVPQTLANPSAFTARFVPLREDIVGDDAPPLWLLVATTTIIIIIACTSVAGTFLGEALSRSSELSLRAALGAGNREIGRLLVTEQALRVTAASLVALVASNWLFRGLTVFVPAVLAGPAPLLLDRSVFLYALLGIALTAVVFGVGPALLVLGLRRHASVIPSPARFTQPQVQRWLVAIQLAFSLVLLVCAALLAQTLSRLTTRPLGFDARDLAVVSTSPTSLPDVEPAPGQWPLFASWQHTDRILEAIEALPVVHRAAAATTVPFGRSTRALRIRAAEAADSPILSVQIQMVTPGYFDTMGIPLISGRNLHFSDRRRDIDQRLVRAVASSELQRQLGGNAIGKHLESPGFPDRYEIVGVVGNVKQRDVADEDLSALYTLSYSHTQATSLIVRMKPGSNALPDITHAIRHYDPTTLVTNSTLMSTAVDKSIQAEKFRAVLSLVFGSFALLLSAMGVYSLGARLVAERSSEFGIRSALGASSSKVLKLVLFEGLRLAGLGVCAGVPMALLASYALRGFVFGVSPFSLWVYALSGIAIGVAVTAAMLKPALDATRVDPLILLRG